MALFNEAPQLVDAALLADAVMLSPSDTFYTYDVQHWTWRRMQDALKPYLDTQASLDITSGDQVPWWLCIRSFS